MQRIGWTVHPDAMAKGQEKNVKRAAGAYADSTLPGSG